jgi:hypothetical protein
LEISLRGLQTQALTQFRAQFLIRYIANVESLTLTGTANIDATGSATNKTLTGNNVLDGGAGVDAVQNSGFADQLDIV